MAARVRVRRRRARCIGSLARAHDLNEVASDLGTHLHTVRYEGPPGRLTVIYEFNSHELDISFQPAGLAEGADGPFDAAREDPLSRVERKRLEIARKRLASRCWAR